MGKIVKFKVNVVGTNPRKSDIRTRFKLASDYVFFELSGPRKNVVNNFSEFDRSVLTERERDLIDIAVSVFMADISVRKNQFTRERQISLLIPVSDTDFWNRYSDDISSICSFLDRNPFYVHFINKKEEAHNDDFDFDVKPDVVCCFSGGLDSLAGAHEVIKSGKSVLLATVIHGRVLAGIANSTYESLQKHHGVIPRFVFNSSTSGGDKPHQFAGMVESSMNCRSFLYLVNSIVVAHRLGAKDVLIPENGIFSLNIPLNPGRLGTRTVHPLYIQKINEFCKKILPNPLNIINPFERLTKTVVVTRLNDITDSVSVAVSCAHAWRSPMIAGALSLPKSRNCGSCHPCMVRRISLISAGMERYDSNYVIDIFNHLFPRISSRKELRDASIAVLELLKFSYNIRNLESDDILFEYPEFEEITAEFPTDEAIEIYKRFAIDVKRVFEKKASGEMKTAIREYLI